MKAITLCPFLSYVFLSRTIIINMIWHRWHLSFITHLAWFFSRSFCQVPSFFHMIHNHFVYERSEKEVSISSHQIEWKDILTFLTPSLSTIAPTLPWWPKGWSETSRPATRGSYQSCVRPQPYKVIILLLGPLAKLRSIGKSHYSSNPRVLLCLH